MIDDILAISKSMSFIRMKHLLYIFFLPVYALLCIPVNARAQQEVPTPQEFNNILYTNGNEYLKCTNDNSCFYNKRNLENIKFKTIVMLHYEAYKANDSSMKNKTLDSKTVAIYNKKGELTRYIYIDYTDSTDNDSIANFYNGNFKITRTLKFTYDTTHKKLVKSTDMILYYNKQGLIVKDSAWERP